MYQITFESIGIVMIRNDIMNYFVLKRDQLVTLVVVNGRNIQGSIVFAHPHYNADQERSHMVASVRHFGYSRTSGRRTVVSVLMTSSFSPSTLENSVFKKHRFQIAPL